MPRLGSKFLRLVTTPQPKLRLFCFPYAGGSAAVFNGWGESLKPQIEVWAAQPGGRGARFREVPHASVAEMVHDYLSVLRDSLDLPFALYGHSLGALVAFELARHLESEGLAQPRQLFVGASTPPAMGLLHPRIHHLPDEPFVTAVQDRYSGIPEAVLQEPELMELFLPSLRADFTAHETFDRTRVDQIDCPITAIAGADDTVVPPSTMEEWCQHTRSAFELMIAPGDHFFLASSRAWILNSLRSKLGILV